MYNSIVCVDILRVGVAVLFCVLCIGACPSVVVVFVYRKGGVEVCVRVSGCGCYVLVCI